jgi:putative Holliday junction resolvase
VQQEQTPNHEDFSGISQGRLLALDLGTKRIGVAVTDELQLTARPLIAINRRSWKELLNDVAMLIESFDAAALVLGLPSNIDGSPSAIGAEVHRLARNFRASLKVPVFLQDERLTTRTAHDNLRQRGLRGREFRKFVDSEAATIILEDFLDRKSTSEKRKLKGEKE